MLYVCLYVCIFEKGSFNFDLNDANFSRKIEENTGRVYKLKSFKSVNGLLQKVQKTVNLALFGPKP